jgi:hypothetical protein
LGFLSREEGRTTEELRKKEILNTKSLFPDLHRSETCLYKYALNHYKSLENKKR